VESNHDKEIKMADFSACFEKMIKNEGGFKLHTVAGDKGGMTYAGIARNFWPDWPGWKKIDADQMDADLVGMVQVFYKENFWDKIRGDDIPFQNVAFALFDFGVNAGVKTAVKIAQKVIGAVPDGIFGPASFAKLNAAVSDSKDSDLFIAHYSLGKIYYYKDICMGDSRRKQDQLKSNLKFLCGWINRVQGGAS
jgi:lysozyme family protein